MTKRQQRESLIYWQKYAQRLRRLFKRVKNKKAITAALNIHDRFTLDGKTQASYAYVGEIWEKAREDGYLIDLAYALNAAQRQRGSTGRKVWRAYREWVKKPGRAGRYCTARDIAGLSGVDEGTVHSVFHAYGLPHKDMKPWQQLK
jgi:hypothetical protein